MNRLGGPYGQRGSEHDFAGAHEGIRTGSINRRTESCASTPSTRPGGRFPALASAAIKTKDRRRFVSVPLVRSFPQVTASRRRRNHCKNPNAVGQPVWVDARDWARPLRRELVGRGTPRLGHTPDDMHPALVLEP